MQVIQKKEISTQTGRLVTVTLGLSDAPVPQYVVSVKDSDNGQDRIRDYFYRQYALRQHARDVYTGKLYEVLHEPKALGIR